MSVITLTTDLGKSDHYLALLKGRLVAAAPKFQLIDITHAHQHFTLTTAAYTLAQAWQAFPEGSLHLCSVGTFHNSPSFLFAEYRGHYFALPDNGLLSLILAFSPLRSKQTDFGLPKLEMPKKIYRIETRDDSSFPQVEVFEQVASHLAKAKPVEQIGVPARQIKELIPLAPVISDQFVRASILYIDHFGNAILNINKKLFERVSRGRPFALFFKNNDPLTKIHRHYGEVEPGEPLCLFNSAGLLEIAVNMGHAAELFNLHLNDSIQIDFLS